MGSGIVFTFKTELEEQHWCVPINFNLLWEFISDQVWRRIIVDLIIYDNQIANINRQIIKMTVLKELAVFFTNSTNPTKIMIYSLSPPNQNSVITLDMSDPYLCEGETLINFNHSDYNNIAKLFNGLQRLIQLLFFPVEDGAGLGISLNPGNVYPLPNWNLQKYSIYHSDDRQVGTTKEFLCAPN